MVDRARSADPGEDDPGGAPPGRRDVKGGRGVHRRLAGASEGDRVRIAVCVATYRRPERLARLL
ncbi:MAG: hypothetical protein GWN71_34410, partial [Gammaproteobacteria bacterium]|nr:hypothetical protein [Gemmatimonadota bacterium]NIU78470.1 hypothetical protein [Gammaproteobacteria bacterium]